jgi:hypothetical protein
MNELIIIAPTVVITASAVLYGYWLARRLHNVSECDLCSQRNSYDADSDSPIFDAMDMEYEYSERLTKPLNNENN